MLVATLVLVGCTDNGRPAATAAAMPIATAGQGSTTPAPGIAPPATTARGPLLVYGRALDLRSSTTPGIREVVVYDVGAARGPAALLRYDDSASPVHVQLEAGLL